MASFVSSLASLAFLLCLVEKNLASCISNFSTQGLMRKASLEVMHKYGPCSPLNPPNEKANITAIHIKILNQDKKRVKYLYSMLPKNLSGDNSTAINSITLPAYLGVPLDTSNYIVVVGLGTPMNDLTLVFDTGSSFTWTQCEPCVYCKDQLDPIFDQRTSTSFKKVEWVDPLCAKLFDATGNVPIESTTNTCEYLINYMDGASSLGDFSKDRLTLTSTDFIDDFLFGCGFINIGDFSLEAGILALGRHSFSAVQQTSNNIFSYCLPSAFSLTGHLTFGPTAAQGEIQYIPFSTNPRVNSYSYGLDLAGILVNDVELPIDPAIFSDVGTMIDSGTVITRLPPIVYDALRTEFRESLARVPITDPMSVMDTCYDLRGYDPPLPKVSFVFANGIKLELPDAGVIYKVSERQQCLAFAASSNDHPILLGNVQQRTLQVVYDIGGGRIGFGAGGCS